MALPVPLPFGMAAIYGNGFSPRTGTGIILPSGWLYGNIDSMYDGGAPMIYQGTTVLFKEADVHVKLVLGNATYTLVEAARLVTEQIPP
jgi:hypothetical protein